MGKKAPWRAASALAGSVALTLSACGGSDESSAEEFCELIAQAPADDATGDELITQFDELVAAAPSEVADQMNRLGELFTALQNADAESGDASEEDLEAFFADVEEFESISAEMEEWTVENCPDLEPGAFTGDG